MFVLAASAPVQAQEFSWTFERPDAVAPLGVFGDRTLPGGAFEIGVHYARVSQEGIRFGSDFVDPLTLFETFDIVPFGLNTDGYFLRAGLGITDALTLAARGGFVTRVREQLTQDLSYFVLESEGISDVEVQALYGVWASDAVRAHLHGGVSIPTGNVEASGGDAELRAPGTLPYDMQLGAGAWGFSPGVTAQVMNESGSVGAQLLATLYLLEKQDWRLGDRVEGNIWAGYRLNDFFSASARLHVLSFEGIVGFDPALDPARDPGEWPISFAGTRVDLPVGLNLYIPEGRWQGHRLSVELSFPVHESFEGPWLATDWGASVGWQFGL
jgi:hypothetical protein